MGHNSGHVSASASSQSFQGVGAGGRLALQVGSNTPGPVPPSQSYAAVVSGAKSVKQLEHHNQHQLIQNIQRPSSQLKVFGISHKIQEFVLGGSTIDFLWHMRWKIKVASKSGPLKLSAGPSSQLEVSGISPKIQEFVLGGRPLISYGICFEKSGLQANLVRRSP